MKENSRPPFCNKNIAAVVEHEILQNPQNPDLFCSYVTVLYSEDMSGGKEHVNILIIPRDIFVKLY